MENITTTTGTQRLILTNVLKDIVGKKKVMGNVGADGKDQDMADILEPEDAKDNEMKKKLMELKPTSTCTREAELVANWLDFYEKIKEKENA